MFGARKMHVMLNRPEIAERHGAGHVARCTVERLMRDMGLHGIRRAKSPRTTRSAPREQCPADLVNRHFAAFRPNELWVSDITYVRTFSGWVYVAFVTDVYSRRVIGWQTSTSLYADLALDALEMAVWARRREGADLTGPGPPLRPRGGVPGHPLRADPGPVRGGRLGGLQGGLLSASLWPRPSTPCTRPSSSATRAPGRASTMSSSPPPSGSTGTTRCAPTAPSACAPRPSTRPPGSPTPTTRNNHNRPPPEPTNRASTKPGA